MKYQRVMGDGIVMKDERFILTFMYSQNPRLFHNILLPRLIYKGYGEFLVAMSIDCAKNLDLLCSCILACLVL